MRAWTRLCPAARVQLSSRGAAGKAAISAPGEASVAAGGRAFIGRLRQRAALLAKSFQGFIDISPLKIQVMVTTANSRPLR